MEKEITIRATYQQDSKRYHRFSIDVGQGVTGAIYVPKNETVPDTVTVRLKTKGETQKR